MTFLPVNSSEDILFESPSHKHWSCDWYVIVINSEKRFRRLEGKNSRTLTGLRIFQDEATKLGSSVPRIPEMSCCTFVLFKDKPVGT